jgi:hypothetical protein
MSTVFWSGIVKNDRKFILLWEIFSGFVCFDENKKAEFL